MTPQGFFATPKIQCDEKNDFVSALQVLASRGDSREFMPGRRRVAFRFPLPAIEVSETATSEPSVIRLIALGRQHPALPRPIRHTYFYIAFFDLRPPCGRASDPNQLQNPLITLPMIKKLLLSLSAVFCMMTASAQTQTVKGRVIDENDAPVIGATVVVKDRPTIGTSTDVKGEFVLQGVPTKGGGNFKSRTSATRPRT